MSQRPVTRSAPADAVSSLRPPQWADEKSATVDAGPAARLRDLADSPGYYRASPREVTKPGPVNVATPQLAQAVARAQDFSEKSVSTTIDELTFDEPRKPPQIGSVEITGEELAHARLVVAAGHDKGKMLEMRAGRAYVIGRGLDANLVLTDIAASRKHFDLRYNGEQWVLQDLGSGNGTAVNGVYDDNATLLWHGDQIEIGNTQFTFEHPTCPARGHDGDSQFADTSQADADSFDSFESPKTREGHRLSARLPAATHAGSPFAQMRSPAPSAEAAREPRQVYGDVNGNVSSPWSAPSQASVPAAAPFDGPRHPPSAPPPQPSMPAPLPPRVLAEPQPPRYPTSASQPPPPRAAGSSQPARNPTSVSPPPPRAPAGPSQPPPDVAQVAQRNASTPGAYPPADAPPWHANGAVLDGPVPGRGYGQPYAAPPGQAYAQAGQAYGQPNGAAAAAMPLPSATLQGVAIPVAPSAPDYPRHQAPTAAPLNRPVYGQNANGAHVPVAGLAGGGPANMAGPPGAYGNGMFPPARSERRSSRRLSAQRQAAPVAIGNERGIDATARVGHISGQRRAVSPRNKRIAWVAVIFMVGAVAAAAVVGTMRGAQTPSAGGAPPANGSAGALAAATPAQTDANGSGAPNGNSVTANIGTASTQPIEAGAGAGPEAAGGPAVDAAAAQAGTVVTVDAAGSKSVDAAAEQAAGSAAAIGAPLVAPIVEPIAPGSEGSAAAVPATVANPRDQVTVTPIAHPTDKAAADKAAADKAAADKAAADKAAADKAAADKAAADRAAADRAAADKAAADKAAADKASVAKAADNAAAERAAKLAADKAAAERAAKLAADKAAAERAAKLAADKAAKSNTGKPRVEPTATANVNLDDDVPGAKGSDAQIKDKAAALYVAKKFADAAKIARTASSKEVKNLAASYEGLGRTFHVGMAPGTKPTEAMRALSSALAFDSRAGRKFSEAIRDRIGEVAPSAAGSFLASKQYVEAFDAVRAAEAYGDGDSSTIRSVKKTLEAKAGELFAQAKSAQKSDPDEAETMFRQILRMVESGSKWHQKAQAELD